MRMLLLIILIPFMLISKFDLMAQDGVFFHKSIRISFKEIVYQNCPVTFELFQYNLYSEKHGSDRITQFFSFDSLTNIYQLSYSIMTIGGGHSLNLMKCPVILAQLNVLDSSGKSIVIPMRFDICEKSTVGEIEILNIDLNALINQPDKLIVVDELNAYKILDKDSIERHLLLQNMEKIEFEKGL